MPTPCQEHTHAHVRPSHVAATGVCLTSLLASVLLICHTLARDQSVVERAISKRSSEISLLEIARGRETLPSPARSRPDFDEGELRTRLASTAASRLRLY